MAEEITTETQVNNQPELNISWNEEDDKILKEWVDKSACFKWLHDKASNIYQKSYLRQMIPVIIISTLTGASNFAIERIDEQYRSYATLIIGGFNILAGIISTVSQFLKTAELKEGHLIASKSWDKFNRNLKLELQRSPEERTNKRELFNISMKEYDRLVEISPQIPPIIIKEFQTLYKDSIDLIKPEITGFIIASKVYEPKKELSNFNLDKPEIELNDETILKNEYIEKFREKYSRLPTTEEISEYIELRNISTV